ncbi:hypothetical protein CO725_24215 [Vibrio parahaemolyticus]|uniref:hypothetical protein n=1 Tax=Vibrio parahaemolyticus TaxID=670 RepID=UPI000BE421B9|nr:hypothetical protein [Vibrio parahaemolyticus]ATI48529.1 hypothetical protein CO725_24215 [Vibrio parahaemolyticus]
MNTDSKRENINKVLKSIKTYKDYTTKNFFFNYKGVTWEGLRIAVNYQKNKIIVKQFPLCFEKASEVHYLHFSKILDKFISHLTTIYLLEDLEKVDFSFDKEEIEKMYFLEVCANLKKLKIQVNEVDTETNKPKGFFNNQTLEGLKITFNVKNGTITVVQYPDCFEELRTSPVIYQKLQNAFFKAIESCKTKERHNCVRFVFNAVPVPYTEKEGESSKSLIADAELERRIEQVNSNIASAFVFKSNGQAPIRFSYTPDRAFINKVKELLHPNYASLFADYHEFNSETVYVETKDFKINVYDNHLMNEALTYLVNHYAKKAYRFEPFELPAVLNKLMLLGSPTVDIEELSEQVEEGTDKDRIEQNSMFDEELFIDHFAKFKMKADVRELSEFIINNFTHSQSYTHHRNVDRTYVRGDKNNLELDRIISSFCETKKILKSDLFLHYSTLSYEELRKIYLFMFYEFYHLYHKKKIPDDLFSVKKDNDSNKKAPKKKNKN